MVIFGILRVEVQIWIFDNRDKYVWEKNYLKYYVFIYIFFVVYNICLDQLFLSKFDVCDINNGFCFVEDIYIIK